MKKMRLLIVAVVVLVVGGAFAPSVLKNCGNTTEEKTVERVDETAEPVADDEEAWAYEETDEADDDTTQVEVPDFVKRIFPGGEWDVEEFCMANGETYYWATEYEGWKNVLYASHGVILANPLIPITYEETGKKNQYLFTMMDRQLTVDFSSPAGARQLSKLDEVLPGFKRFTRDTIPSFGRDIFFSVEADFPTSQDTESRLVREWLAGQVVKNVPTNIPPKVNPSQFGDAASGKAKVYDYAASLYFATVKSRFGNNDEDYPLGVEWILSMRARISNSRLVTYQKYIYQNDGKVHGDYREELLSYDHVHQQDIDFGYLFQRGSEPAIRSLACKLYDMDELPELPQPGIGETGVVFSYQPYEIGSFADGAFHFTIPFNQLKPYLTERGRWCLGM